MDLVLSKSKKMVSVPRIGQFLDFNNLGLNAVVLFFLTYVQNGESIGSIILKKKNPREIVLRVLD